MNEINVSKLTEMPEEAYVLIDIRDKGSTIYGVIPGAVNIPAGELERDADKYLEGIDRQKKLPPIISDSNSL